MRRYCSVETYTDNYVDYDERWTRSDIRQFGSSSTVMVELMQKKITDISIRLIDGVLTSPADITEENLDRMQWEVFQWFIIQPQLVVREVLDLGEAVRRQSLLISEESPVTEDSTSQQLTPTS